MASLGVRVEVTEEGTEQRPQYENLPNGNYLLQMESAEVVEKNQGASDHSVVVKSIFEVLEPEEFKGRKLFGNYNLKNKSEIAQKIGNEQFQCLLRAIEVPAADDSDDLLFRSFMATVGLGKDSKDKNADGTPVYPAKPEIKRYWYPDIGDAPQPGVTAAPPSTKAPANDNRPAPANDNRPAAAQAGAKKSTPWGKPKVA
jgi:hypothetical protein